MHAQQKKEKNEKKRNTKQEHLVQREKIAYLPPISWRSSIMVFTPPTLNSNPTLCAPLNERSSKSKAKTIPVLVTKKLVIATLSVIVKTAWVVIRIPKSALYFRKNGRREYSWYYWYYIIPCRQIQDGFLLLYSWTGYSSNYRGNNALLAVGVDGW